MQIDVDSPISEQGLRRICDLPDMKDARYLDRIP